MKQVVVIIIGLVAVVLMDSCRKEKSGIGNDKLELADAYMTAHPEVSLQILDSLNNTDYVKDHYFALLYAQAKYRNYVKAENDSLIIVALNYYSQCSDSTMKARAFLVAAQVYDELGDDEMSLDCIHKSAQAAIESTDWWTKSFIQYFWGCVLRNANDVEASIEKFELSLKYAERANDTIQIISRMEALAFGYLAKSNYEQSLLYLNRGIELSKKVGSYADLSKLYGRKAQVFYYLDNYAESLRYIDEAVRYNKYVIDEEARYNLNFKGRLLMLNNRLDSAHYYIEQGCDTTTVEGRNLYYGCMSMLKERQGDYVVALEYERTHYECLLDMASQLERDKIAELDKRYNRFKMEAENLRLKVSEQQSRMYVLWMAVVFVVVAFAVYVVIARRRRRVQQTLLDQRRSISQLRKSEARLREERLQQDEEAAALVGKLDDREKELAETREQLADTRRRQLYESRVVKRIMSMLEACNKPKGGNMPQPLDEQERKELVAAVNACYDNFTVELVERYPSLDDTDVLLCCLMRMGFDNPAMCVILGMSDNTLRKRKSRMKNEKLKNNEE